MKLATRCLELINDTPVNTPNEEQKKLIKKIEHTCRAFQGHGLEFGSHNEELYPRSSLLCEAARRNLLQVTKYLVEEKKLDPNVMVQAGQTPLGYAIICGHREVAKYLAEKHQGLAQDIFDGYTVLHYAAEKNYDQVIRVLLKKEPELIKVSSHAFSTALHIAAERGNLEALKALQQQGNLNHTNSLGLTPYGCALAHCRAEIVSYLLERNLASPLNTSYFGMRISPLELVLKSKNSNKQKTLNVLFDFGVGLDTRQIPMGVLELFKLDKRKEPLPFLVSGFFTHEGKTTRKLVAHVDLLVQYLMDEKWTFQTASLARVVNDETLSHVKEVQTLKSHLLSRGEPLPSGRNDESMRLPSIPKIEYLYPHSQSHIKFVAEQSMDMLEHANSFLRNVYELILQEKKIDFDSFEMRKLLHYDLFATCKAWSLLQLSNAKKIIDEMDLIEQLLPLFNQKVAMVYYVIRLSSNQTFKINHLCFINETLTLMIRDCQSWLPNVNLALFNSLVDAKVLFTGQMARIYSKKEETESLALLCAQDIEKYNQMIRVEKDNIFLLKQKEYNEAQSLFVYAQININQGCYVEAYDQIKKALFLHHVIPNHDMIELTFELTEYLQMKRNYKKSYDLSGFAIKYLHSFSFQKSQVELERQEWIKKFTHAETQAKKAWQQPVELLKQPVPKYVEPEESSLVQKSELTATLEEVTQEPTVNSRLRQSVEALEALAIDARPPQAKKERQQRCKTAVSEGILNHGFTIGDDLTPCIPIEAPFLPSNTLFLSVKKIPQMDPFTDYLRDKEYISGMGSKRLNKQGVKLFKSGHSLMARLKILGKNGDGKLRAMGQIQQSIRTTDEKKARLYVIDQVCSKKQEQRRRYRY